MALTPLQAAAAGSSARAGRSDYFNQILTQPTSSDERAYQRAFHTNAQSLSNRMFGRLQALLGGTAPTLNFVPDVGANGDFHASATPAKNMINVDPAVTGWLLDERSPFHDSAVNVMPHEMAHLRQTAQVLASLRDREGGAQSFADIVSPLAASAAKTRYAQGSFDGAYAPYVQYVNANKGRDWVLGGQFGKPPVAWP